MSLLLLFRVYGGGGPPPPPPPPPAPPSGVRHAKAKRQLVVRMGDVVDRESTAEYIKAQLKSLHQEAIPDPSPPTVAKLSKGDRKRDEKRAAEALANMQIEAANEERRIIEHQNQQILALILLSSQ